MGAQEPLATLTQEQLSILLGVSSEIPMNWRSRFFSAVGDLLTLTPHPTNREVVEAVSAARRAMTLGDPPSAKEKHTGGRPNNAPRAPYRRRAASSG